MYSSKRKGEKGKPVREEGEGRTRKGENSNKEQKEEKLTILRAKEHEQPTATWQQQRKAHLIRYYHETTWCQGREHPRSFKEGEKEIRSCIKYVNGVSRAITFSRR